jgi:GNAT superfamily N-acetyltransferase
MSVLVRPAKIDDLTGVLPLLPQLTVAGRSYSEPPADAARAALEDIIESRWFDLLIAVDPDTNSILGTVTTAVIPNLTSGARPWMALEAMVVDQAARRRGVGEALIKFAVNRARERGCYKVELQSRHERSGAHAFYEAVGFQPLAVGFKLYLE